MGIEPMVRCLKRQGIINSPEASSAISSFFFQSLGKDIEATQSTTRPWPFSVFGRGWRILNPLPVSSRLKSEVQHPQGSQFH